MLYRCVYLDRLLRSTPCTAAIVCPTHTRHNVTCSKTIIYQLVDMIISIRTLKVLYSLAEVNPATAPNSTYISNTPIINEPLFAGERKPNAENNMRNIALITNCMPVPTSTQNNIGYSVGGRKTSACTNFHPVSSRSSAFSSSVGTYKQG